MNISLANADANSRTHPDLPDRSGPAKARPAFSIAVIIPLYNGARHIEEALLSVFRQTLPPAEVIVVDDGSTDGGAGAAIVSRLGESYPLKLMQKPNGGQSAARNFGLTQTTCDLIAFLDHDDIWYEHHLAKLSKPFHQDHCPPLGWVYSDVDEVDEDGAMVCRSFLTTMATVHPKRTIFDCIGQDMFILPSASLIARTAFEQVGGFDERLCGYEDDDLFLRLFRAGYNNIFLKRPLSKWRISTRSASYSPRMTESRRYYATKLIDTFPDDVRRARYYIRDSIVPRFYMKALHDYNIAIKTGDQESSECAWKEMCYLAGHSDVLGPTLIEASLARHCRANESGDTGLAQLAWRQVEELSGHKGMFNNLLLEYTISDYRRALVSGDHRAINTSWSRLTRLAKQDAGRRLCFVLALLRWSSVSKVLFAIRHVARPFMIWAFRI